ncbi:MAG: hypothetical protein ABL867_03470 [Rickettsiales bacterium]
MGIEAQSVVLTDELVKARLELLTRAAANGDAHNAMYDTVTKARNSIQSDASPAETVKANEQITGQWLSIQKKRMEEGKPVGGEKDENANFIKNILTNGFDIVSIAMFAFKDKISIFAESVSESWNNKDEKRSFGNIFAEKTQEHKIRTFAANNGIDGDRLLAEIKNPPKETEQLAKMTTEEQLVRLSAIEKANAEKVAQARKDAEDAEVARQVRAAEEFEKARKRLEAKTSEKSPDSKIEEKKGKGVKENGDRNVKGTKTSAALTGAQNGLKGVASEVAHADDGVNITPPTNAAIIGGTASKSM